MAEAVLSPPDQVAYLRDAIKALPPAEYDTYLKSLTEQEAAVLLYNWKFWGRRDQQTPVGDWFVWLALAGRGWGKTRTGAEWVHEVAEQHAGCMIALIGRIPKDVRRVMVEGESGILACAKPWFRPKWNKSLGILEWPNGSQAQCFSSEVPDDLRGPQFHFAWIDEWAKFRFPVDVWDMLMFALRLGRHPRVMVTTTPRPLECLRTLMKDRNTHVTVGSTFDNAPNLPASFLRELKRKYEGTTLGAQELYARLLEDTSGALWSRALLDATRVKAVPKRPDGTPAIRRAVLGVDPSVTSGEDSDDTGLVLDALCEDGHAYVLEDFTGEGGFDKHAALVVDLWRNDRCDLIVGEVNNGGDLVEHTIRTVRDLETDKPIGQFAPYKSVRATKGKLIRAEPVSMLYQQKVVHHVGSFADLEDQMCTWVPHTGQKSPNNLDAHVWAMHELMVQPDPEVRIRSLR